MTGAFLKENVLNYYKIKKKKKPKLYKRISKTTFKHFTQVIKNILMCKKARAIK